MNKKDKKGKLEIALKKNLRKRKIFQKKQKKIVNRNVYTARFLDKKNVQTAKYD